MQIHPGGFSASSLPAEGAYSANQEDSVGSSARQVKGLIAECMGRRSPRCLAFSALCFLAVLLGYLLLIIICNRSRAKVREPGPRRRRLAGSDDDEEFFELQQLCAAAVGWNPAEPPAGGPRDSPHLVEAFFQDLEQSVQVEGEAAAAAEPTPGGADDGSGDELPGPSWKYRRSEEGRASVAPAQPATSAGPSSSSAGPPSEEGPAASSQAEAGPAPPGLLPVSGDGASTSTATPPPRGRPAPSDAAVAASYTRLPALTPGTTPRPWRENMIFSNILLTSNRIQVLNKVRTLLLQPVLGPAGLEALMEGTETLANYACHMMKDRPVNLEAHALLRFWGVKFVVFSTLHAAARVASPTLPPWLAGVAQIVLRDLSDPPGAPGAQYRVVARVLTEQIRRALRLYRSGDAPSPEEVRDILKQLFLGPKRLAYFKSEMWDLWRDDFRGASQ